MIAADQKLLTYDEAGQRLGRTAWFIRSEVKRGRLIATVLGYNSKFIAELDLLKYLERNRDQRHRK